MSDKIQRFLWTVAGAEISILEKCRTDHKKFSAIGAIILMTAFIALCAGTSAAWYFTQRGEDSSGQLGWALVFGLIWAILIFCIDRSLVITLKKDPALHKQKFWVPLLSRAILASIIAFMVSIPLELVVFEDFIAEQKFFFDESAANELSENTRAYKEEIGLDKNIELSTVSINRLDKLNVALDGDIGLLRQQISTLRGRLNQPTTTAYKNAKEKVNNLTRKINAARANYNFVNDEDEKAKYSKEISDVTYERNSYSRIVNNEIVNWNAPIQEKLKTLESEKEEKLIKMDENNKRNLEEAERLSKIRDQRDAVSQEKKVIVDDFKATINKGNHFIQNFRILEYAAWKRDAQGDLPTELFFLWMIRLLFFIVEILPTVVKIVTPIGSYDRMVHAEEQNMINYLNSSTYMDRIRNMHDIELHAHEDQLRKQHEVESNLKNEVLDKVKEAQLEVSEAVVQKWKNNELNKVQTNG